MPIEPDYQLKTKRCILRHVTEKDIPYVFSASRIAGFNDGMQWDPPSSPDDLIEPYKNSCKAWLTGNTYVFTIESHQGIFIGRISIRKTNTDGLWNIGFWTHPDHQNQGYMTESVSCVLNFGFDELSANEIEACHASWNGASKKVLERCDMLWREHIEKGFKKRGEWVAEERLSVTKSVFHTSNNQT